MSNAREATKVTWSHIARRHCENDKVLYSPSDSGGDARQQSHIALLQDALRCPQDIGSGARLCLECGRRFHDVFRLAQHIKDKHKRVNETTKESQSIILSECVQFPQRGPVRPVQPRHHHMEKVKKAEPKRREGAHVTSKNKKPSSLKKAYLKEKAANVKESWSLVLASLDESIRSLEAMKHDVHEEKVAEDGISDWNALEILYQKEHILDRNLARLRTMRELCAQRLQHVDKTYRKVDRKKQQFFNRTRSFFELDVRKHLHDEGIEGEDHEGNSEEGHEGNSDRERDLSTGDENAETDVMYDSEDSISSDDSFDLQWGDTLQNWAQNIGHMNLRHLSLADVGSRHEGAKPIVVRDTDDMKEHARSEGTVKSGAVRVISTYRNEGNPVEAKTPDLVEEDFLEEHDSRPWILDLPEMPTGKKPTSCAICAIPSLGPDEWERHQKSEAHRKKVFHIATRELQLKSAMRDVPLTKGGHLSTDPKKYTGLDANVEAYVSHIITDELNQSVYEFLSKLISWQERSRKMDPMNAKKKKRFVCGMREAAKAVKLGKVKVLIVAPNVQPVSANSPDGKNLSYPVVPILEDCQKHGVPFLFALTRRKMGSLLGQRKNVSLFAILNVSGAEDDLKALLQNASSLK